MKDFIWHFRCMLQAKKYMKVSDQSRGEYFWYRYLVMYSIEQFIGRFKFWQKKNDLPF